MSNVVGIEGGDNMKFETNGFDELSKHLKKMQQRAEELQKTESLSIYELFSDSFMKKNTRFDNIDDFFKASDFDVSSNEAFEKIEQKELDKYVAENSKFKDWKDMNLSALGEYTAKKLGL